MHSSTNSALGHLIMPRSILTHTPSPACLACRCYTQCGAIEASQVTEATPRGILWDNSRDHVPTTGVFNDEKQNMGRHESSAAACAAQRAAIGVCTVQMQRWTCGRQCALHRSSSRMSLRACGGGDHQRRESLFVFRATHARPADEMPPC